MRFDNNVFEHGALVYPQPIAISCGRIYRAATPQEQLDSILKCSEVVTRYLAAVSFASYAARQDLDCRIPKWPSELPKNLAFGDFLTLVQSIAGIQCEHPLRSQLVAALKPKDQAAPNADASLVQLLNLRNNLGHDLASLSEARALAIFENESPDRSLESALEALEPILRLPLFLIEEQYWDSQQIIARRVLLMGESGDPPPDEVQVQKGFSEKRALYLGIRGGALLLKPFLLWGLVERRENFGIYFLHAVNQNNLKYVTVNSDSAEKNGVLNQRFRNQTEGTAVPMEPSSLSSGIDFPKEWLDKRKVYEEFQQTLHGEIPWSELDMATLRWYGRQLGAEDSETSIRQTITERLLDGRERLTPEEVRQIILAFGTAMQIRQQLGRNMLDCRARKDPEKRWDERVETDFNVIESLKTAVEFFGRHVGINGVNLDGLKATSGTADYIAMREALVNLFIHQDYKSDAIVAQIEITPERAMFFNAGKSLVSNAALVDGGKSQSRNPLLSRALRLIGFAELAGSGLREVHRVWRNANRRPPIMDSNSAANSFTLILDWRELPDVTDKFWKQRLGVSLTPNEAKALLLSAEEGGANAEEIASATGILVDDAKEIMKALQVKALVDEQKNRIYIQSRLKELVEEAKNQAPR